MWLDKADNQDNELGKQSQANNPSIGAGGGDASGSTGGTTAGNTPSMTPATPKPQTTQKFATVQDYLKTNQPQAEDLGQKFTSSLDSTLGTEKGNIDSAANQTKKDITAGSMSYDAGLTNQALNDPNSVASDPNKYDAFTKQYNAQYTGPQSFEQSNNYGAATGALNQAQQIQGQLGSTGGREQLIQDQFGVYGQGNKGLDQALLQTSSAFPKVQDQEKQFGGIQDYITQQAADTNAQATKAATDTAAAQTNTRDAFAGNLTGFQNQINGEVNNARTNYTNSTGAIQNDLKTGNGDALQKDLTAAGIPPQQIQQYLATLHGNYNVTPDLSNYFSGNPATDINAANVATPEEYAKAAALQKLTGNDYSGVLNPSNIDQSGKTPGLANSVKANDLNSYLQGQVKQQDSELLSKGNLTDISKKLGLPDFNKSENYANPDAGHQLASKLIDAAERTGDTASLKNELQNAINRMVPDHFADFKKQKIDGYHAFRSDIEKYLASHQK